jgi:hypothetical protein
MRNHLRGARSPDDTHAEVANAYTSWAVARQARLEQERLRDQEQEAVIRRLGRLEEENHLGALVWRMIRGNE